MFLFEIYQQIFFNQFFFSFLSVIFFAIDIKRLSNCQFIFILKKLLLVLLLINKSHLLLIYIHICFVRPERLNSFIHTVFSPKMQAGKNVTRKQKAGESKDESYCMNETKWSSFVQLDNMQTYL